jgi:hypothetical protein
MKVYTTRKVIILALFLIPVISSVVLSINLNASAAEPNDYVVGGTIIPTNNLFGPWVAIIAVLALIVAAAYRKGKSIPNT